MASNEFVPKVDRSDRTAQVQSIAAAASTPEAPGANSLLGKSRGGTIRGGRRGKGGGARRSPCKRRPLSAPREKKAICHAGQAFFGGSQAEANKQLVAAAKEKGSQPRTGPSRSRWSSSSSRG